MFILKKTIDYTTLLQSIICSTEDIGIICQIDTDSDTEEAGAVPATRGATSSSSSQDQAVSLASDTSPLVLSDHNSSPREDYTADAPPVPLVAVIGTITSVQQVG